MVILLTGRENMLHQGISFKQAAFIITAMAAVQFCLQASLLLKGIEYAAGSLVIDDTYYYLQTAWNAKVLGYVTFDGLHTTNGVQFLWFVIIYGLAMLATSKTALLFATLIVNFLLNGLCFLVILRTGMLLKQPTLALFMASLWALQSLPFRIYSMGMENSLHALVFWGVLWQCAKFLIRIKQNEEPNFWGLTVVLILFVWTRLDSALLATILFSYCVGTLAYTYRHNLMAFWNKHNKTLAGISFLAAAGLIAQLAAYWLMGDSILPVSALVKTSAAGRGTEFVWTEKLADVFLLGMPAILQGRFPAYILVFLGLSAVLLVILAKAANRDHSDEVNTVLNLWICLMLGEAIYYVYVALSGVEYTPYFIWYRSPSFIFWILTASLIAYFSLTTTRLAKSALARYPWAPAAGSLIIFAVAIYLFGRSIDFTSKLYVARYRAALWIGENSSPDAVFAAWNAGQLGYFSNRTFINLDGVINSVDYYERVLTGDTSLTDYLDENNVDFIVDYDTYGFIPDFPVVHTFPLNDGSGRTIRIWQVSPSS